LTGVPANLDRRCQSRRKGRGRRPRRSGHAKGPRP